MIPMLDTLFTFHARGPRRVRVQAYQDPRGQLPAVVVIAAPPEGPDPLPYRGTIALELLPLLRLDPETVLWVERIKPDEYLGGSIEAACEPPQAGLVFHAPGRIARARLEALTGHRIDSGPRVTCPAD